MYIHICKCTDKHTSKSDSKSDIRLIYYSEKGVPIIDYATPQSQELRKSIAPK